MAGPCSSTNWRPCRRRRQDRLLRAVEYGEVTRIGASKPITVDVRIVAATNEHLPKLVLRAGSGPTCSTGCRSRLSPCRRCGLRKGDMSAARRAFRAAHGGRARLAQLAGLRPRAPAELEAYSWPGNVRELRNAVERAVYRAEDPEREIDAIQFDPIRRRPGS